MDALVKWWFIFWACVIGAVVTQNFDLFAKLWTADVTKLSFVTLGLFVLVTGYIGVLINDVRKATSVTDNVCQKILKVLPTCWFSTEAMNALGMIGTVTGFIIMLSTAFHTNLNPSDIAGIQRLITSTAIGLSTAATTTLVGLVCATITKLQLVVLEKALDEKSE